MMVNSIQAIGRVTLLLGLTCILSACPNQGSGKVTGTHLQLEGCHEPGDDTRIEPFDMKLDFMSVSRNDNVVLLNFSNRERRWPVPDIFVITLNDLASVQDEIAEQGFAERDVVTDGVGITLALIQRCENMTQSLRASTGTLKLTSLEIAKNGHVSGEVTFDLVDLRNGESAGKDLHATFSFRVLVGTPHQPFTDPFEMEH